MNKPRLEKLAKFLEGLPDGKFYMGSWITNLPDDFEYGNGDCISKTDILEPSCGTACCIAGWAAIVANKRICPGKLSDIVKTKSGKDLGSLPDWAARYLGLDEDQTNDLFYTSGWPFKFKVRQPTTKDAADRIRHMIQTGE